MLAAGIIAGIGNLTIKCSSTFSITGIAAGTLIVLIGYHGVRLLHRQPAGEPQTEDRAYEGGTMISTGNVETPEGEVSPFRMGLGSAGTRGGAASPFREGEGEGNAGTREGAAPPFREGEGDSGGQ
jgi:hypothetical protein